MFICFFTLFLRSNNKTWYRIIMSIIQNIRDKGAAIVIGVIALSLIGFLLMDASSGAGGGIFGGDRSTHIGEVNGFKIELDQFNKKVKQEEAKYGGNVAGAMRQQIQQGTWDQMVGEQVVATEFNKLGLAFTGKEMSDIMFSDDAPQMLKQAFTDQQTGVYDVEKAKQWWAQTKKLKTEEQREDLNLQIIDPMKLNALYSKYTSMIAGSMYTPSWLSTKENEEGKAFATISYVAIPYTIISDSSVTVTDNDIEKYLEKNKDKYKREAGRLISYVSFNAAPSKEDSTQAISFLEGLKAGFATDTNARAYVTRNNSAIDYFDGYTLKSKMAMPDKDTIIGLVENVVYGPYLDGKNYVLAKKVGSKILPDSIKCRHILIGTNDPQTGQATMADSVAKKKIDSIETAIKGGAGFKALSDLYSTDQVAKKDTGVMTFDITTIQSENFAKEFAEFLLNDKGETKKTVKTQFGWHYIEILEKKNPEPAYKVAYLAKEVVPSEQTINAANGGAIKLAGQARNLKAFDKYVADNGIQKVDVPDIIKENDFRLGGLTDARTIIKWAFEAKEGEVSDEPFPVGTDYIVPVVRGRISEGLPDVKSARPLVETFIRNDKKAAEIKKKLGNPATLEAAAAVYQKEVLTTGTDSTLMFTAALINGVGNEPKVAGAAFNKEYQTKISPPIAGNTGVFLIKVNSIGMRPADSPEQEAQIKNGKMSQEVQQALSQSFNALKKLADIIDQRSKFF